MAGPPDPPELNHLIQAARAGDRRAIGALLRDLGPWIRAKARQVLRRTGAPLGVSSLSQETKLRLSRSLPRMRAMETPQVKAMIKRIANNTAKSALRAELTLKRTPDPWDPQAVPVQEEQDPFTLLHDVEQRERLLAALQLLTPPQQEVVRAVLAGDSADEIAARLKTTPKAVHSMLQRAKATLVAALAQDDPSA